MFAQWILAIALVPFLGTSVPIKAESAATAHQSYLGIVTESQPASPEGSGVVLKWVFPNSPAAQAGLHKGDRIVKIEDQQIQDGAALAGIVGEHKPGDRITFHIQRDGKDRSLTVVLGERSELSLFPRPAAFLGVFTTPLTSELRTRLGVTADSGVVIQQVLPGTPAAQAGLAQNDVIIQCQGKPISNPRELRQAIHQAAIGTEVTLNVLRGKESKEFKVQLEANPADIIVPTAFDETQPSMPILNLLRDWLNDVGQRMRDIQ
jgi:S1-C subfamily serine protease